MSLKMSNIIAIAGRELRSYFTSPMAYALTVFFLGVTALLFTLGMLLPPRAQVEDFRYLMGSMVFLILIITPVLTMGLLAQERASGTMELLMTRPVQDWEVVVGKFLGGLGTVVLVIVLSLIFPLVLEIVGDVDWGMILAGYLGLLLAGAAFVAVGVFASSLTSSQITAAIITAFVLLFFWLIGWISYSVSQGLGDVLKHLSLLESFNDFGKGIVDTKNIIYFLSLIVVGLFLGVRSIENRRTI